MIDAATELVWNQWAALGSMATPSKAIRSVVDPEALVLASMTLRRHEPRLDPITQWWAAAGARLMSVQRAKNIASMFPADSGEQFAGFAVSAREAGDNRWKSLDTEQARLHSTSLDYAIDGQVDRSPIRLTVPAAMLLRMRLGFGVGVKPDILTYLISIDGQWATVKEIASFTGYTHRAVKRAADELAHASFIRAGSEGPRQYQVGSDIWKAFLGLRTVPRWYPTAHAFAVVCDLRKWDRDLQKKSDYIAASLARDFVERHESAVIMLGLEKPSPTAYIGSEYLSAFEKLLASLIEWLKKVAEA